MARSRLCARVSWPKWACEGAAQQARRQRLGGPTNTRSEIQRITRPDPIALSKPGQLKKKELEMTFSTNGVFAARFGTSYWIGPATTRTRLHGAAVVCMDDQARRRLRLRLDEARRPHGAHKRISYQAYPTRCREQAWGRRKAGTGDRAKPKSIACSRPSCRCS